jgi:hypothetical protein
MGPFCYLCGKKCVEPDAETMLPGTEGDSLDFADRILCSDGACIGVINEKGICKECGKPYTPES